MPSQKVRKPMNKLWLLGALIGALFFAPPAQAQQANALVGWECNSGTPVGWCAASTTNPLPTTVGPYTVSRVTADGSVKASSGQVHTVTFSPTGAVVAGVITLYDSTTESGTAILSVSLPVTTFTPFSVQIDGAFTNGLFVGYDASVTNVQVTTSYR